MDEVKNCDMCPHTEHAGAKCSQCDCDMTPAAETPAAENQNPNA